LTFAVLIPGAVRGCLDAAGLNHRPILLTTDTDISLSGQPAREWLVVTPDHISIVDDSPSPALLRSVSWSEIAELRTTSGVGSGILQAQIGNRWVDLIRYSNSLATRFHKICRRLEILRSERDSGSSGLPGVSIPSVPVEANWDVPRCRSCSLRLSTAEESCPRCMQRGQILRRVSDLLRPYRRSAVVLCLLTVAGVAAELVPPKLQQYMVDNVLNVSAATDGAPGTLTSNNVNFQTALLLVVLALAFSRVLLSIVAVVKGRIATAIGTGLTSSLRSEMVQKLQSLAVSYYDRHQVGSMLSRVAHDSEVLHGLMHQVTGGFLLQTVQLFGVGAMLVWINPKLALYTLIPVPLVFLGSWIFWQKVYPRYYRLWDASSKQMSVLNGMLSGIRVVKAFGQEDREYDRFQRANDHLRQWRLWVEYTNANYSAAMQIVFSLGGLIVWYVGGRDVIGRDMTLGQLIAFLAYLAMFYAPLGALSSFTSWLTSFLSGSKRVLELLDTPVTVMNSSHPTDWQSPRGAIEFDHVTFGYDRNQPVIRDVSFTVDPGEMIGIVGRSGSGKTTMVNLLGRFYDVQEGRVLVDGIDVRDISTHQLRDRIGIVFQDSFLFRGTIWKNLSYGRPATTIEQGLAAAKAAGAHDFICRQQLGYETLLGEHGAGLSGGEKQRLSIARTLLYDPRILIFDEATSNIDAEAERSIQEALEVLTQGRTTIAIAHRLSTLRNADRILVFDRGQLVEQGSHADLLASDGTYARLVRIQTQVSKAPSIDKLVYESNHSLPANSSANVGSHQKVFHQSDSSSHSSNTAVLDQPAKPLAAKDQNDPSIPEGTCPDGTSASGVKKPKHQIVWLDPATTQFAPSQHDGFELWIDEEQKSSVVFVVRTFPASQPDAYLSVRGWDEKGDEVELGMIRDLISWPADSQSRVRQLLARRYLLRQILRIHSIKLEHGFLEFDTETDVGRQQFTLRWTASQAVDFGENGKLLIDTEENRYVLPDLQTLPAPDREKFLQHVYW
jgi:ATP-binding cassette, subfamily B, bacterial